MEMFWSTSFPFWENIFVLLNISESINFTSLGGTCWGDVRLSESSVSQSVNMISFELECRWRGTLILGNAPMFFFKKTRWQIKSKPKRDFLILYHMNSRKQSCTCSCCPQSRLKVVCQIFLFYETYRKVSISHHLEELVGVMSDCLSRLSVSY